MSAEKFWGHLGAGIVKASSTALTVRTFTGLPNIPRRGGYIVVANHVSEFDPIIIAHFVLTARRWPAFLTKAGLFRVPLLGPFLHRLKQIPVQRQGSDARLALDAAAQAIRGGHGVIIYPEGTTPKSGDLSLRKGKTGAARLFLATGAPVIPVVSWGAQDVFDPRTRRWHVRRRSVVTVSAGVPLDLSRWRGAEADTGTCAEITDVIMAELHHRLGEIRPPQADVRSSPPN